MLPSPPAAIESVEAEDVVQHKEAALGVLHEVEDLRELQGVLLALQQQHARDEDDDAAGDARGLAVARGDLVLALGEGQARELVPDLRRPAEGRALLVIVDCSEYRAPMLFRPPGASKLW